MFLVSIKLNSSSMALDHTNMNISSATNVKYLFDESSNAIKSFIFIFCTADICWLLVLELHNSTPYFEWGGETFWLAICELADAEKGSGA